MAPKVGSTLAKSVASAMPRLYRRNPWLSRPRAYVTLLTSDGDVMGVVALAKGLRKVKSKYPLVVAVLPKVTATCQRILKEQGCKVRRIERVDLLDDRTQFSELTTADHVSKYSKLCIWQFVEYSKMVYLEKDMQVFHNIDDLFDEEDGHIYAVLDCFCEGTWSGTPQYDIGYCQICPDGVQWREELGQRPLCFNDGMFVFEPSLAIYNILLRELRANSSLPFPPQRFLSEQLERIHKPLPLEYNLPLSMLRHHQEKVDLENVKVVQYCDADSKPWRYTEQEHTDNMQREDIEMLVNKWRDICNDETLDSKSWMGWLRKSLSRSRLWS